MIEAKQIHTYIYAYFLVLLKAQPAKLELGLGHARRASGSE